MAHNGNADKGTNWGIEPLLKLGSDAFDYWADAAQRTVIYADVKRQRGDQYREHLSQEAPNVLNFPSKLLLSGLELARPVNYALAHILPSVDRPTDPNKRPFIIVDPRAGHGPGVGGFKPESEVGAALKEGHPCYFVGFLPDPVPGQTVEDVMRAEAAFVRHVGELHLGQDKPVVIGNCQAGWQILMTASVWPELFGPIIVAGAPMSYWAGDNPMRYAGGLLGGSWMTALAGDIGAGRFDGATLVQNFENLDPANTLWKKNYNLYSKIDTEPQRYLEFEKYWGGYVFLNDIEMQYIVDNLFIGNKLATAQLLTSDGIRIDFRNIRSPIVVFSSYGDNITPPPQALGWITDLYRNDDEILSHDQTIIYATHDDIGHLGIFVSSSVGRKEHQEFASAIDLIDLLPAGVYQATVETNAGQALTEAPDEDGQFLSLEVRSVADVRGIVRQDLESEKRFAAVARLSQSNLGLYRQFVQPWVRAAVTPDIAPWIERMHPLRLSHQWSSAHPLAQPVAALAEQARENRHRAESDNPFILAQEMVSSAIAASLDQYRDARDHMCAVMFESIYSAPLVQALTGMTADQAVPPRPHPGDTPEHRAFVAQEISQLDERMTDGGLLEAGVRALFYVLQARGEADGRHFRQARELYGPTASEKLPPDLFKRIVREQAKLMRHDPDAAIGAIAHLLSPFFTEEIRHVADALEQLILLRGTPTAEERDRLAEMLTLFGGSGRQTALLPQPARAPLTSETPTLALTPVSDIAGKKRSPDPQRKVSPRRQSAKPAK